MQQCQKEENLALSAIKCFVNDLFELSGRPTKSSPLVLYHRIIQHIDKGDSEAGIKKCSTGFVDFFKSYADSLVDCDTMMATIPKGTIISYNERIYIEIQKCLYKASAEDKDSIRRHLLTIHAIMEPNEKALQKLEENDDDILSHFGLPADSPEGKYIADFVGKLGSSLEGKEVTDPINGLSQIMANGEIPNMLNGLRTGLDNGTLDMHKLMGAMSGVFANMLPKLAEQNNTTKQSGTAEEI